MAEDKKIQKTTEYEKILKTEFSEDFVKKVNYTTL